MNQLKTPGVYVNEIDAFPASVVEVETAIPAFIGYTYKEDHAEPKIVRIKSLAEFVESFGIPEPNLKLIEPKVTKVNNIPEVEVKIAADQLPKNILYYAMQLFFDNGGGPCYIVSVGKAANALDKDKLKKGIAAIRNYDEPTLLVIPEAVKTVSYDSGNNNKIDAATYTELIGAAIEQAEQLKDRFVIIDVPYNEKI